MIEELLTNDNLRSAKRASYKHKTHKCIICSPTNGYPRLPITPAACGEEAGHRRGVGYACDRPMAEAPADPTPETIVTSNNKVTVFKADAPQNFAASNG